MLSRQYIKLDKEVINYYGINISKDFSSVLKSYSFDMIYVVCDENAYKIHGHNLTEQINQAGVSFYIIKLKSAESNKTFSSLEWLCNELIQNGISKDSIILGFGGGMICNLTGMAAALIFRGIRYIEVPTTFMGQTDSSLSNKQAINGKSGKNQIGTYYAPIFIWTDLTYILTENINNIRAAFVEGIKNALIYDSEVLPDLRSKLYQTEYSVQDLYNIYICITKSKNKILAKDPSEKESAVILEYGHTIGHAVEFLSKDSIIHGEAVAIGMCIMATVSAELGYLEYDSVQLHYELLLPFISQNSMEHFCNIKAELILKVIMSDNKRNIEGVKYVLLEKIGKCLNDGEDYLVKIDESKIYYAIHNFQEKVKRELYSDSFII